MTERRLVEIDGEWYAEECPIRDQIMKSRVTDGRCSYCSRERGFVDRDGRRYIKCTAMYC